MAIVKSILLNFFSGASAALALLMVAVAYSDRLDPANHSILACTGMLFPFFLVANLIVFMLWLMIKWKRAWVPLLAFLVSYPAIRIYMPLHLTQELPQGTIKVLSYNVACYSMDKIVDHPKDSVISYLRQQNADIVCLQEDVMPSGSLADYLDMYPYHDTVHVNNRSYPIINALGIHTRYPIIRKERIKYYSMANGTVAYFLQIGADTVIVVNNHLETTHLTKDDRQRYKEMISGDMTHQDAKAETQRLLGKLSMAMMLRAAQARTVHQYVETHSHYPIIVCGDFNDTPISYVRRTMAQDLTDCYVESGNGLGISFKQKGFYFRIDQMMCSSHFAPYNCYVDNQVKASDHYPIICWLKRN